MQNLKSLLLQSPVWTLAAAESVTCGRVQARIGEISGASGFFLGGMTAYTLDQKVRHLGVERASARRVNSVSGDVAGQMACGVCRLFGSDFGVATTGYAEPSAAFKVREPFAWWAIARRQGRRLAAVRTGRVECPAANRIDAQVFVADAVLTELAAYLREIRG